MNQKLVAKLLTCSLVMGMLPTAGLAVADDASDIGNLVAKTSISESIVVGENQNNGDAQEIYEISSDVAITYSGAYTYSASIVNISDSGKLSINGSVDGAATGKLAVDTFGIYNLGADALTIDSVVASNEIYITGSDTTPTTANVTLKSGEYTIKVGYGVMVEVGGATSVTWTTVANGTGKVVVNGQEQEASGTYPSTDPSTTPTPTPDDSGSTGGGGSGDSGSTGGGGGSSESTSTSENTTVNVRPTVDADGDAATTVSDASVDSAISQANKNKSKFIVLKVNPSSVKKAKSVKVSMSPKAAKKISDQTNASVKFAFPAATVILSNKGIGNLAGLAGKTVSVAVAMNPDGTITINILADGSPVGRFGGIKVSLPLTSLLSRSLSTNSTGIQAALPTASLSGVKSGLPVEAISDVTAAAQSTSASENHGVVVVLVNDDGTKTIVKKSALDGEGNVFAVIEEGTATLKAIDNTKSFDDMPTQEWSKNAVIFASSHELFQGTGDNMFSPTVNMTRAMLVTVLSRLENAKASGTNVFNDVEEESWYTDAVAWASEVGITNGTGDGGFNPTGSITRQDLATMLYRYAKNLDVGVSLESTGVLSFVDSDEVSTYASDAMKWVVGNGIVQGKENNRLDPLGEASRAEVATMLMRLIKLM